MHHSAREAVTAAATERGCESAEAPIWRIQPIAFDPELVALAREACERTSGTVLELPSGALHQAASMAPHVPTAMVFSPRSPGSATHLRRTPRNRI